jgi:hypothetical protein
MDRLIIRRLGASSGALVIALVASQGTAVSAGAGTKPLLFQQLSAVDMLSNNPNGPNWLEKFNRIKASASPKMQMGNEMKSMMRSMEGMPPPERVHMHARCTQMMQKHHNAHRKPPQ